MDHNERLNDLSRQNGADYFGIADLLPAYDTIWEHGGPTIAEYPRAISIGIALPHSVVNQLPRRAERAVAMEYRHHAFEVINQRLDFVTSRLSSFIQQAGYKAMPISASKHADRERHRAIFSHKLAGHLAGLGWIGKSCLFITPDMGPRARWATVLTDAPLTKTGEAIAERCGDCKDCVDICPVNAFTGQPFREEEPREVRYNASKCAHYLATMKEKDPELAVCGLCLYVCPYGRRS